MDKKDNILLLQDKYINVRKNDINGNYDKIQNEIPIIYGGNVNADIMVIARDLGKQEVIEGEPLIGRAGRLFRAIAKYYGLMDNIYMTNLVPYKPNKNIVFPKEIRNDYLSLLAEQIKIIQPKIIMTLGKESLETIRGEKIASVLKRITYIYKNKMFEVNNVINSGVNANVLPIVHPSFLVRKGLNENNIVTKNDKNSQLYLHIPLRIARALLK